MEQKDMVTVEAFQEKLKDLAWFLLKANSIATFFAPEYSTSPEPAEIFDDALVSRIISAYQTARSSYSDSESFWDAWTSSIKGDIHEKLLTGSLAEIQQLLRNPLSNRLLFGFENICIDTTQMAQEAIEDQNRWIYDAIICFSTMLGVIRLPYPELGMELLAEQNAAPRNIDELLDGISAILKIDLKFPNPYPGEMGLPSKRGIISLRAVQALYQAYRIRALLRGKREPRVLEIGAGLGRTAYFAHQMGIKDYTIIDIPMSNVAQAYFLGRTLGEENVVLGGEHDKRYVNRGGYQNLSSLSAA